MSMDLFEARGAVISPCGCYRYLLWRGADNAACTLLFIMLNPSTADGEQDDNTIRLCISWMHWLDCQRLEVVNFDAWRATDPSELLNVVDPVGPENDRYIAEALQRADVIILGWGQNVSDKAHAARLERVKQIIYESGKTVCAIKVNKDGTPAHPLYKKVGTPLIHLTTRNLLPAKD